VRQLVPPAGPPEVGFFWEKGSAGDLYSDYFRRTALQLGLDITKEVFLQPNPKNLTENLAAMRALGTEAVVYVGYGYSTFHFAEAFRTLGWDPPRIMGTAFMFYSNSNEWAQGLEGWHGIDQLGEDGKNPNYEAMRRRFEARVWAHHPQRGWSRSPTTRPASRCSASRTRASRRRSMSRRASR